MRYITGESYNQERDVAGSEQQCALLNGLSIIIGMPFQDICKHCYAVLRCRCSFAQALRE